MIEFTDFQLGMLVGMVLCWAVFIVPLTFIIFYNIDKDEDES